MSDPHNASVFLSYGVELTRLKQICRKLKVPIPNDLKTRALKLHLLNEVSKNPGDEARQFITELKNHKRQIIAEAEKNPGELKNGFMRTREKPDLMLPTGFFLF